VPAKNHAHDLDAMLAAITPNTRIVFVANPNNRLAPPPGREELARFVNAVPATSCWRLDEAYIEFLNEPLDLLPEIRNGGKPNLLFDANVLKDLRPCRFAGLLRHRASRLHCALEKNPPAVQHQFGGPGRARSRRWTTPNTLKRRARSTRADSGFTRAPSAN